MKLFKQTETTFDNFDDTVRAYLAKTFNNLGMEYSHSQIFGVIFDGVKGIMQNIMFYIEDALQEQNIYTASRKQSIYSLAKISGYEPYYGSAASGTLSAKVSVTNVAGIDTKLFIDNYCRVRNETTNMVYSIYLSTNNYVFDLNKPLVTHNFTLIQGFFVNNQYVANGESLEVLHISSIELYDRNYLRVKVDGKEWKEVGNLYDMVEDGEQYVLTAGYDNAFDIMFGNGIHGKKHESGQLVQISYLKHAGTAGNILPDENSQFKFLDKGYDTFGNQINLNNYIKLQLSTCVSGGTQSDTIGFIRRMIGYNSRSLVLTSNENFILFFKRFSFVGYVNCWAEQQSMSIIVSCMRNFKRELSSMTDYYSLKPSDMLLDNRQKQMIQNTLENSNKSFAGLTLKFKDPILRKYAIIAYVKVDNIYNRDITKQLINKYLCEYFIENIENTQFIAKSVLIKLLHDNIESILSVDLDIISEADQYAKNKGFYETYDLQLVDGSYQYVKTTKLYDGSEQIGLDDFGNIQLNNKFEFPILHGNFDYYFDDQTSYTKIEPIQIYFID